MKVSEMRARFMDMDKAYYEKDTNLDRFIIDTLDAFDGEIELKRQGRTIDGDYAVFQLEDGAVQFGGIGHGFYGCYAYTIELTHAIVY